MRFPAEILFGPEFQVVGELHSLLYLRIREGSGRVACNTARASYSLIQNFAGLHHKLESNNFEVHAWCL